MIALVYILTLCSKPSASSIVDKSSKNNKMITYYSPDALGSIEIPYYDDEEQLIILKSYNFDSQYFISDFYIQCINNGIKLTINI